MSEWLIMLCYFLVAYGTCNVIIYGSGPFSIFERLRDWAYGISDHFGMLFSCMMCLPTNFGIIFSLVDWFLIKDIALSPFNIILGGLGGAYWILAMLCDGAITSGVVWLINTLQEYFENKTITSGEKEVED